MNLQVEQRVQSLALSSWWHGKGTVHAWSPSCWMNKKDKKGLKLNRFKIVQVLFFSLASGSGASWAKDWRNMSVLQSFGIFNLLATWLPGYLATWLPGYLPLGSMWKWDRSLSCGRSGSLAWKIAKTATVTRCNGCQQVVSAKCVKCGSLMMSNVV